MHGKVLNSQPFNFSSVAFLWPKDYSKATLDDFGGPWLMAYNYVVKHKISNFGEKFRLDIW